MLTAEIRSLFSPPPNGLKTLIITIGNPLRADDGVGPYIAAHVRTPREHLQVLDAGERPENVLDEAAAAVPARILIIDAADFGGAPGEVRIIEDALIPEKTITTHSFPAGVIAKILAGETGAQVLFLGVQAQGRQFSEGLSPEVAETARKIIGLISSSGAF